MSEQPQDAATKRKRKRVRSTIIVSPELKVLLKLQWHKHCDDKAVDVDFEDYMESQIRAKVLVPTG